MVAGSSFKRCGSTQIAIQFSVLCELRPLNPLVYLRDLPFVIHKLILTNTSYFSHTKVFNSYPDSIRATDVKLKNGELTWTNKKQLHGLKFNFLIF